MLLLRLELVSHHKVCRCQILGDSAIPKYDDAFFLELRHGYSLCRHRELLPCHSSHPYLDGKKLIKKYYFFMVKIDFFLNTYFNSAKFEKYQKFYQKAKKNCLKHRKQYKRFTCGAVRE